MNSAVRKSFKKYSPNSKEINEKQYFDIQNKNEYFSFGIIRNPYKRLISFYKNLLRDDYPEWNTNIMNEILKKLNKTYNDNEKKISFEDLVLYLEISDDNEVNYHLCSQYKFLENKHYDFLAVMENQDDINYIMNKTGFTLKKINVSKSDDNISYYNDKLKKIVYKRYLNDF